MQSVVSMDVFYLDVPKRRGRKMESRGLCKLCQHMNIKKGIFGGRKMICSVHNCKTSLENGCVEFVPDGNKVLRYAGFRGNDGRGSGCGSCVYREGKTIGTETIYSCRKNNVQFWPGFFPMEHVCNHFKDGGLDPMVDLLADIIIDKNKKEGK